MITLLIMLSLITFSCRYIFLEPKLPIRLNYSAKQFLSYSAPAVLSAIAAPIIFFPEGELAIRANNRYIWAALLATVFMLKTNRMLSSVTVSFIFFIFLDRWL